MNASFFHYFFGYIFRNKTRQKLIFLAIIGLLISSFSLTVLQGVMGGLQSGLIGRSKNVLGEGHIDLKNVPSTSEEVTLLKEKLLKAGVKFSVELQLELMIQNDSYVSPIILHGVDYDHFVPEFLKGKNKNELDRSQIIVGSELGSSLRSYFGSKVKVTSPAHTDFLLQEIPRQVTGYISDFVSSELPEIDSTHGWVRLGFVHNLIRRREVNKFRIYADPNKQVQRILEDPLFKEMSYVSWENQHSSLVWALNLETRVMFFLFTSMSLLIGICITSGFLIFYNKIKVDLVSFWIIGMSKDNLFRLIYIFGQGVAVCFCALGVLLGAGFLFFIDSNSIAIMPEQFVERNIPVNFSFIQMLLGFFVPYFVASVFTHYTFKIFKKDNTSFISHIKKLG